MRPAAHLSPPSANASLAAFAARFLREEDGATLVEYVLLIALIAAVCVGQS